MRFRISSAALLVNVTASRVCAGTPCACTRCAMRCVITRVFAAAGAGEDQQRTIDVRGRVTLLGI